MSGHPGFPENPIMVETDQDITIIGGGMVGLALALRLATADSRLRIAVVEPQPEPLLTDIEQHQYDHRVSALTLASVALLSELGCWDNIERRACAYEHMHVWDGEGTASIQFDAADLYEPQLGFIVENSVILAALCERLAGVDNIEMLRGWKLQRLSAPSQGRRQLQLLAVEDGDKTRDLSTRLLVAADGARSRTRQLAGLAVHELDYQHQAIVTTVELAACHQHTAWQCFTDDGPLALLPLTDPDNCDRYCSIVWSTSPDHARELMALEDEAFCMALTRAFEARLGNVVSASKRYSLPLAHRHAPSYVAENLALVGDAAHSIHPLAGQGVNLGFMDAAVLADEVLSGYQQAVAYYETQWLRRYQRRRQGENMQMLAAMAGFRWLYGQVPPWLHGLRNIGMHWVDRCNPLKALFARQAMAVDKLKARHVVNERS